MKKDSTEVVFILDRSGSMAHLTDDTIGGFNSFIEKQKTEPGECKLTTVLFDDQYEILHDGVDLKKVSDLTNTEYFARGMTALLDAVGRTINAVGDRLNKTDESERPEQVIFVITTDGMENSSTEFTAEKIKEMVSHQEDTYNWKFLFLGANIDSFATGGNLGFSAASTTNYDASTIGTQALYATISNFVSDSRAHDARAVSMSMTDYMKEAEDDVKKKKMKVEVTTDNT